AEICRLSASADRRADARGHSTYSAALLQQVTLQVRRCRGITPRRASSGGARLIWGAARAKSSLRPSPRGEGYAASTALERRSASAQRRPARGGTRLRQNAGTPPSPTWQRSSTGPWGSAAGPLAAAHLHRRSSSPKRAPAD